MFRKLAIALIGIFTILPQLANALGIGEIQLESYLNQPLQAKIELLQTRDLTQEEILPGLASRSDFQNAGVERFFFLTDLRFKVHLNSDGTGHVIITSRKPVKEPFLNFLVEVHWPAGRLLREYTLLLDPPVFVDDIPPVMAVAEKKSVKAARVGPANQTQIQTQIQSQIQSQTQSQLKSALPQHKTSASRPRTTSVQSNSRSSGQQGIYRTVRNDNLWSVAKQLRPSSDVTVQQTMVALVRQNPNAFIDNNINLMKSGQVLRVPDAAEARSLTAQEAIEEVARQNRAWQAKIAARRKSRQSETEAPQIDGTARGLTPTAPRSFAEGKLKLVSADAGEGLSEGNAVGDAGTVSGIEGGTITALQNEQLEGMKLQNQDLKGKVDDLSTQVKTTEQLISLKDDQIAALQAKMAELEELTRKLQEQMGQRVVGESSGQSSVLVGDVAGDGASEDIASGTEENVDFNYTEEVTTENTDVTEDSSEIIAASDISSEKNTEELNSDGETAGESTEVLKVTETTTAPGLVEQLLANKIYVIVAGLFFAVLVAVFAFGRKNDDEDELEPIEEDYNALGGTDEGLDAPNYDAPNYDAQGIDHDEIVAGGVDSSVEGESSYTQDEVQDDQAEVAAADDGELGDIIGEADIYIAYGRFPQAIEMLENAIASHPARTDIQLKLLEVFVETGDTDRFRANEEQLMQLGDAEVNASVAELRTKVLGEEPLPEITQKESSEQLDFSLDLEDDNGGEEEFSFETSEDESEDAFPSLAELEQTQSIVEEDSESLGGAVNYSAGEGLVDGIVDGIDDGIDDEIVEETGAEAHVLNFSLDDETTDELEGETEFAIGEDSADGSLGSILSDPTESDTDLEFSLDDGELAEIDDELKSTDDLDEVLEASADDFNLDDTIEDSFSLDDDETLGVSGDAIAAQALTKEPVAEIAPPAPEAISADDADFSDLSDDDEDMDFLSDADETATKLDLARAYIDMGDREGAKDILDEVLLEGNGEQQEEAKSLLDKVS